MVGFQHLEFQVNRVWVVEVQTKSVSGGRVRRENPSYYRITFDACCGDDIPREYSNFGGMRKPADGMRATMQALFLLDLLDLPTN